MPEDEDALGLGSRGRLARVLGQGWRGQTELKYNKSGDARHGDFSL